MYMEECRYFADMVGRVCCNALEEFIGVNYLSDFLGLCSKKSSHEATSYDLISRAIYGIITLQHGC